MAASEHLGRQFLDRHLVAHHGYGQGIKPEHPADFSNESNNHWHAMEHEVMEDIGDKYWGENQVPHHHSEERIHFH